MFEILPVFTAVFATVGAFVYQFRNRHRIVALGVAVFRAGRDTLMLQRERAGLMLSLFASPVHEHAAIDAITTSLYTRQESRFRDMIDQSLRLVAYLFLPHVLAAASALMMWKL